MSELKEKWRPVNIGGMQDYRVSNYGQLAVMEHEGVDGRKLKARPIDTIYYNNREAHLSIDGKMRSFQLGRLVALTFLENDDPTKKFVLHIDNDSSNNRVDNLRWVNRSVLYRYSKDKSIKGVRATKDGVSQDFPDVPTCSKALKVPDSNLTNCLNGKAKTAQGYTFEWIK